MIGRILADGFWSDEWSYMADPWNWLDAIVVVGSLVGLVFPQVTIIRVLRAFRPLRIAVRLEEVRVVIIAIGTALPALLNTAIFCLLFWLVLSILGVHLFADKYPAQVIRSHEIERGSSAWSTSHQVYSVPFGLYANTSFRHEPLSGAVLRYTPAYAMAQNGATGLRSGSPVKANDPWQLAGGTQPRSVATGNIATNLVNDAANDNEGSTNCLASGGKCWGYNTQELKCGNDCKNPPCWVDNPDSGAPNDKCITWSGVSAPAGWTDAQCKVSQQGVHGSSQPSTVYTSKDGGGVCQGLCYKYRTGMSYYPKCGSGFGTGTPPLQEFPPSAAWLRQVGITFTETGSGAGRQVRINKGGGWEQLQLDKMCTQLGRDSDPVVISTVWQQQYLCAEDLCEMPLLACKGDKVCERNKVHEACSFNFFNFNSVGSAWMSLYKLGQMTSWYQELYTGIRSTGTFAIVFFLLVVLICGFFTLNLIIAVVVDNFDRIGRGKEYSALLTKPQAISIRSTRLCDMFPLIVNEKPPKVDGDCLMGVRATVWYAINRRVPKPESLEDQGAPLFDNLIMFCIAANAVSMMQTTNTMTDGKRKILELLDDAFTIIYLTEAILKIFANWTTNDDYKCGEGFWSYKTDGTCEFNYGWDIWNIPPFKWWSTGWQLYWRDNWNKFDFIVVAASLPNLFSKSCSLAQKAARVPGCAGGAPTATVRLLRLCRLVKVIQRAPMMRACFATLTYALPSMLNIAVLLFIVFYIWSVLGISVFGIPKAEWPFCLPDAAGVCPPRTDGYGFNTAAFRKITENCYNSIEGSKLTYSSYLETFNFNSFKNALIINFRIATNDEWEAVYCWTYHKDPTMTVFYFTSFGMFGTYLMANLFIAVMLMTLRDNLKTEESRPELNYAGVKQWVDQWKKQYPNGRGWIEDKQFVQTLKESSVLVGAILGKLDLRPEATVEKEEARKDFFNEFDPDEDDKRTVTDEHLKQIFLSNKFHVKMIKYGINTPREMNRVYYNNAMYAIAGVITNHMNIQPPFSPGEAKKPRFKRTEIRIAAWSKQGDIANLGGDDDEDIQDGAKPSMTSV